MKIVDPINKLFLEIKKRSEIKGTFSQQLKQKNKFLVTYNNCI